MPHRTPLSCKIHWLSRDHPDLASRGAGGGGGVVEAQRWAPAEDRRLEEAVRRTGAEREGGWEAVAREVGVSARFPPLSLSLSLARSCSSSVPAPLPSPLLDTSRLPLGTAVSRLVHPLSSPRTSLPHPLSHTDAPPLLPLARAQPNRTPTMCARRWRTMPKPKGSAAKVDRMVWAPEDDERLKQAVQQWGENWDVGAFALSSLFFSSSSESSRANEHGPH